MVESVILVKKRTVNLLPDISEPDEHSLVYGAKYFCEIDRGCRGRTGRISDEQGMLRWRYRFQRSPSRRRWTNPFNKPDFIVEDADGRIEAIIRRASFIPPVFHIIAANGIIGRVRLRSLLRNRYTIEIDGVDSWTFRMALFTVQFRGDSGKATDLWVAMGPSEMEWSVLVRPGLEDRLLVPTLAFIHNERWHYA